MASLLLSTVGSSLGSSLLPSGVSFLGANISGAAIGSTIGNAVGSLIDQKLFGTVATREGPRLTDLSVQGSTEGAAIPRVYGRVRLAGQIIWATKFREQASTQTSGGGKGGGGGNRTETTTYSYSVSFAVALCEGQVTRIGAAWADGRVLDLSRYTYRIHYGTESQGPDPLMEAVEGAGQVPAYRGSAYIVFEDMPLADFGNRLPQLSFEVFRALGDVENEIKAVTIIPGSTEFGYDTKPFRRIYADGVSHSENVNNRLGGTDWSVALDDLRATLPNCNAAALVVSWFGDDLRVGECKVSPRVDTNDKRPTPEFWSVAGLDRGSVPTVSTVEGRPAFGGTPSDASVKRAIEDMHARGLSILFYPFLMMDIPAGNALPDPYGGSAQAVYPWRGRISAHPAPGFAGSPDKSASIAADVASFFGTASPSDFSIGPNGVIYSGPAEQSYRRMILHNATLCAWAGGVSGFLIGSELRGITTLRSDASTYPAVAQLVDLAADVRSILGPATKVSYAADWSEYFGHQPSDGSGDVFFHLDPLWANANIDFIGIDNYLPLSDWRDGHAHLDATAGASSIYDQTYLQSNIAGGERFDWYYASDNDRAAQIRTPITDGGAGKPWVFRPKDLKSWWENAHHNRPDGVESPVPTAWMPRSKPFWFTELGCPAVDRGSNQPNVFVDPKSSESHLPYFSRGVRDDYIQRQFIKAHLSFWQQSANNPVSPGYGAAMVDTSRVFIWTWDARPYPSFPTLKSVWSDGDNWKLGHWITGRMGSVPLGLLVAHIAGGVSGVEIDTSGLGGTVDGFVIDRIMSPRQAIDPLGLAYFFDAVETEGRIRFSHESAQAVRTFTPQTLAVPLTSASAGYRLTRGQESELPYAVKLTYIDPGAGYRQAAIEARRANVKSERVSAAALPIVLRQEEAQRIADIWLHNVWVKRDSVAATFPRSALALDPGDVITLDLGHRKANYRLTGLDENGMIEVEGQRADPTVFGVLASPERVGEAKPVETYGAPDVAYLDLPLMTGLEQAHAPHIAVSASPWPGGVALYRSATGSGFQLDRVIANPATMGRTITSLSRGPVSRWDRASSVRVKLTSGTLETRDPLSVLSGANLAALETTPDIWELIQFERADLVDVDTYHLSGLLRGQGGTEVAMVDLLAGDARFVLLDGAVEQIGLAISERGRPLAWRAGPRSYPLDHETYRTETRGFAGVGLRPLSPVHVRAKRLPNNDITFSWVRRTRIDGDNWEGLDVPLGEEVEAYALDILAGETVKRTLESNTPTCLYDAASQTSDFGGAAPSPLTIKIVQLSRSFGRGTAREVSLHV
ncbi:MAG: glycoside hydrolase/phage tail family protein [Parvibaculum sp.]